MINYSIHPDKHVANHTPTECSETMATGLATVHCTPDMFVAFFF